MSLEGAKRWNQKSVVCLIGKVFVVAELIDVSFKNLGVLDGELGVIMPAKEIFSGTKCDLVPVYDGGGKIELRDAREGEEDATIKWHQINIDGREILISERPLLRFSQQDVIEKMGLDGSRVIYLFGNEEVARKYKISCMSEEIWDGFVLNKLGLRHLPQPGTPEHREFWNVNGHFIMTDRTTGGREAVLMDGSSPFNRGYLRHADSSYVAALVLILERIG